MTQQAVLSVHDEKQLQSKLFLGGIRLKLRKTFSRFTSEAEASNSTTDSSIPRAVQMLENSHGMKSFVGLRQAGSGFSLPCFPLFSGAGWGAERALIGDEAKGLGEQELQAQVLKKVGIICRNIRSE